MTNETTLSETAHNHAVTVGFEQAIKDFWSPSREINNTYLPNSPEHTGYDKAVNAMKVHGSVDERV